jgi:hypothetical protein
MASTQPGGSVSATRKAGSRRSRVRVRQPVELPRAVIPARAVDAIWRPSQGGKAVHVVDWAKEDLP